MMLGQTELTVIDGTARIACRHLSDVLGFICADLAGLNPVEIVAKAKAMQKEYEANGLKDIRREMRRLKPNQIAEAIRREGEHRAAQISAFPRQAQEHKTPALNAAAQAARVEAKPEVLRPINPEKRAAIIATFQEKSTPRAAEKPIDRWNRAVRLERELTNDIKISDADAAWLRMYQATPEYRAHKAAHGERMMG